MKIIAKDFENWELTLKNLDVIPKSPKDAIPIGKNSGIGAGIGALGGIARTIKKGRRKKKAK